MSTIIGSSHHADRRTFIGGSDARIIMGDDEAGLLRLWREKRGEAEAEDLSGNLIVQLGRVTEDHRCARCSADCNVARASSLSIRIRVASITRSPNRYYRTRHGFQRIGLPRLLPDIVRLQSICSHCP